MQACERLEIPQALWPKFAGLHLPHEYQEKYTTEESFPMTVFNVLYETENEWRQRARVDFETYMDGWAAVFRRSLQSQLDSGALVPIKQLRGDTPLELRYEWAAKRHCRKLSFKEMSSEVHSPEKIRKTVGPILKELGLKKRK
jgi:hypothetical protein